MCWLIQIVNNVYNYHKLTVQYALMNVAINFFKAAQNSSAHQQRMEASIVQNFCRFLTLQMSAYMNVAMAIPQTPKLIHKI